MDRRPTAGEPGRTGVKHQDRQRGHPRSESSSATLAPGTTSPPDDAPRNPARMHTDGPRGRVVRPISSRPSPPTGSVPGLVSCPTIEKSVARGRRLDDSFPVWPQSCEALPDTCGHPCRFGTSIRRFLPCTESLSPSRCSSACSSTIPAFAAEPLVVDLWPGKVPGDVGIKGQETSRIHQSPLVGPTKLITNVTKPTLTIYRPAKDKNTGTAMVICPGGGYWDLYWELEGEEVAAWLNSPGHDRHHPQVPLPAAARRGQGRAAAGPAARRPAGRQPGPQPGRGMGHRPEADRHGRLLGGRPPRPGDGHRLREADVRADRRHRRGQLPARFRRRCAIRAT